MKYFTLLLATLLCLFFNQSVAQDINKTKIDINLNKVSLEEALNTIASLTILKFNYKTSDIANINELTYYRKNGTVKQILTDLLTNTALTFELIDGYILIKKITLPKRAVTIYGFVSSKESGEALAGATISLSRVHVTISNAYGFYSITVPAGTHLLTCSYAGFEEFTKRTALTSSSRYNIELTLKKSSELEAVEVVTSGNKRSITRTATGFHHLSISEIKKIAMVGGEPDILKSLQFLPGIQTANEGTTNLSIRGGSYDQNLILLDEAPVYNPTHTLGMFSVFNTDALKDVSVYKGVFPAQYGGRLSSVIDVRMKEGNSKMQEVHGGIGLLASRLTYEAPIKKNKSSLMITGRYSNLGALLKASRALLPFSPTNSRVSFYDLNLKINPILGNRDRLFLSAYTGHDQFYLDVIDHSNKMQWGNKTMSARWNHVFNASLFANTSLLYSNYNYSNTRLDDGRNLQWQANLSELSLKTDLDWTIAKNNTVKFGVGITYQNVLPGKVDPRSQNSIAKPITLNNRPSAQIFAYFNDEQQIGKSISINYGLRVTGFAVLGDAWVYQYNADRSEVTDSTYYAKGKIVKAYAGAEPRANLRVLLSPNSSLKFSYGRNYQYQHLLTNSSVGLPTDIWLPSDSYFKPQYSDQFALGGYGSFGNNNWEFSLECYYRHSENIIDFKDNAELFLNDKIETQILTGQAKGYGLEGMLKKKKGKSTGWFSYTFSKSLRQINGINNNEWYAPSYDHRHNFSLVYNFQWQKRLGIGVNWVFRTGGYTTLPEGTYVYSSSRFLYYGKRNGYQLPAYHRLDISITLAQKEKPRRKWQGEWVFSVYDVYNRKNVFSLFVSQDPIFFSETKAKMVYLTGILPTLTYNFKF